MDNKDICWVQRFSNYQKALKQLKEAVDLMGIRDLSNLEKQGMIQVFEYTHELAWKTMKDFLKSRGNADISGSRGRWGQATDLRPLTYQLIGAQFVRYIHRNSVRCSANYICFLGSD